MITPDEKDVIGEVCREDVEARCQPILTLAESLRQYRHNNAEGFVSAYEYDGTRKAFNELSQQLADVSHERDLLRADLSKARGILRGLCGRKNYPIGYATEEIIISFVEESEAKS